MKIKKGFVLRVVGGEHVVVPVGEMSKQFHGMINLNETGAFLWKLLEKDCEKEDLLNALLEEYDVEKSVAESDVCAFITKLTEAGLVK